MPYLPNSKTVEKVLELNGFYFVRQKGSHKRYFHEDGRRVTTVANKRNYPIGTLKSISRQSQIPIIVFLKKI